MIVYKFGGASIKDAEGIIRLIPIIKEIEVKAVVVFSAMAKTTNHLEELCHFYLNDSDNLRAKIQEVKDFHIQIIMSLNCNEKNVLKNIELIFAELESFLKKNISRDYDYVYDQIIVTGEQLSTTIISWFLKENGIENTLLDARKLLRTNSNFRDADVDYNISNEKTQEAISACKDNIIITQGFIGGDSKGNSTSLGREGSDYSAAVFAYLLNAENITVWKDVSGIYNCNPGIFDSAVKLDKISYKEAIELAFYGAKIIHPKTIKPLQNKNIELYVKPFYKPDEPGTTISDNNSALPEIPIIILKDSQLLISIRPKDFSFINSEHLSKVFKILSEGKQKVNLMQNSAISFSICVGFEKHKFDSIITALKSEFDVLYNINLELITVRHYDDKTIKKLLSGREVFLSQKSRYTAQFVVSK